MKILSIVAQGEALTGWSQQLLVMPAPESRKFRQVLALPQNTIRLQLPAAMLVPGAQQAFCAMLDSAAIPPAA